MANTWQGKVPLWFPSSFTVSVADDDLTYQLSRKTDSLAFSVDFGDARKMSLPVAISMGGQRHGLGFLIPMHEVAGIPLARTALVQARYAWSPEKNKLLLAPGCLASRTQSLESAVGLVLSPAFESRCLSCHGQPEVDGSGHKGGIRCEACHGAGSGHLMGIAKGDPTRGIVNPKRLSTTDSIDICARCHVGLAKFADPAASDLLVANQVRAIQNSECFLQSGKAFSCTACHDPHNDQEGNGKRAEAACRGCHSSDTKLHAAICPVNRTNGCVGCHMPSVEMGPLHLVDHLIRVHPEQIGEHASASEPALRTRLQPVSEYLRMISTNTPEAAERARKRLTNGESFYAIAKETSVDRSAAIGGYLGRKTVAELGKSLQNGAAGLGYGDTSQVLASDGKWIILQRLKRDFRWDAEQLQNSAETFAVAGDAVSAIRKAQEALMIYPQFLRALNFIGVTFVQSGNPAKGREVLATAAKLYPQDAATEFALASTLNILGNKAAASEAYKRVIALEPDFTAAYLSLGIIHCSSKDWAGAIEILTRGLQIDPMSAELNYRLGLALEQNGDVAAGNKAISLARNLDSSLVVRLETRH